jgi:hypothetical protein
MRELLEIPVAASAHAGDIDRMTILTHWLMAILFIGWGAFFIYTLYASVRPNPNNYGVKSHMASYLEWAVAQSSSCWSGVRDPAWAARVDAFPAENEATVVRVVAEQFAERALPWQSSHRCLRADNRSASTVRIRRPRRLHSGEPARAAGKQARHHSSPSKDAYPHSDAPCVVHADDDRRLGSQLLAAVRSRSPCAVLPDQDPEAYGSGEGDGMPSWGQLSKSRSKEQRAKWAGAIGAGPYLMQRISTIDAEVAGEAVRPVVGEDRRSRAGIREAGLMRRHGERAMEPQGHAACTACSPSRCRTHTPASAHALGNFYAVTRDAIGLEHCRVDRRRAAIDTPAGAISARPQYAQGGTAARVALEGIPSFGTP